MKNLLQQAFVDQKSRLYIFTNNFFAFVTIISIVSLVLETMSSLSEYGGVFLTIEWVSVSLFALEYIGRFLVSRPLYKYPISFFGFVDLMAVLPTVFGLGNYTFLKSARSLRIIRLLRMVRLIKATRAGGFSKENTGLLSLNVLVYFTTLMTALLFTGTAMYLVEPNLSAFANIPAGMWWSLKVFMAGVPVVEPQTEWGEIFFVTTRFLGLLLFGLLVEVVGNASRAVLGKGK